MLQSELVSSILDTARYIIVRLFITLGVLSLLPAIFVLLFEPVVLTMRSFNKSSTPLSTPTSSRASSRATSRQSSRSPSNRRAFDVEPLSSVENSPRLADFGNGKRASKRLSNISNLNSSSSGNDSVVDEKELIVPLGVIAATAIPTVAVSSYDDVEGKQRTGASQIGVC